MLKQLSTETLKQAHDVLKGPAHVSELETILKALRPAIADLIEAELKSRPKSAAKG